MTVLVLGTPDSGKSRFAESIMDELAGEKEKIYIATMIPFGKTGEERIKKHRKMREGKGYLTIECPVDVSDIADDIERIEDKCCLLECLSNLIGNEIHSEGNKGMDDDRLIDKITEDVTALGSKCSHLVIVSNHFPSDDPEYDEDTRRYVHITDLVNKKISLNMDQIYDLTDEG
ncbi:MAG: bifunctional adenosylcobinamide kinase/adenosylcobinamide-phosphate guanylyltransferase [Lachnospiraceae bacterium]|nr:bifunctional adenosylcobinamide kinase/adenosylcobinamide-phosphate guanylyltransferase [Lachnospiraceae bacterium]